MESESNIPEIGLDADNMYRDEVFSDLKVGAVRRFVPVTRDGEIDEGRAVIYQGQTNLTSPGGQIPLQFELNVDSLAAAIDAFPKAAQAEGRRVVEEMEKMRREQAGSGGASDKGGSRIQMP
ncbi:MAG: hypothetical protein L0H83_03315 [Salinisphaera sp.]|nr:hypothetical protein [Salinisphaera sp.]